MARKLCLLVFRQQVGRLLASKVTSVTLGEEVWKVVLSLIGVVVFVGKVLMNWNSATIFIAEYYGGLLYLIPLGLLVVSFICAKKWM